MSVWKQVELLPTGRDKPVKCHDKESNEFCIFAISSVISYNIAEEKITEDIMKKFHRILKEGTMDSRHEWFNVGEYKKLPNEAGGMKTTHQFEFIL